jgi:beta-phosphoglucomutase-like phosphatase (HAD superfamily)
MLVIFDLDGTLALTEHRAHFLQQQPKDWPGFYAACDQDVPNLPIIEVLHALRHEGHDIEIWSGRSDEVAEKTMEWLEKVDLGPVRIRMRAEGDHQPDYSLKAGWLSEIEKMGAKPDLVFEDRDSMVAMYRARGIVCCQVAPGAF